MRASCPKLFWEPAALDLCLRDHLGSRDSRAAGLLRMPLRGSLWLPFPGSPPQQEGIRFVRLWPVLYTRILPGRHCHPQVRCSARR